MASIEGTDWRRDLSCGWAGRVEAASMEPVELEGRLEVRELLLDCTLPKTTSTGELSLGELMLMSIAESGFLDPVLTLDMRVVRGGNLVSLEVAGAEGAKVNFLNCSGRVGTGGTVGSASCDLVIFRGRTGYGALESMAPESGCRALRLTLRFRGRVGFVWLVTLLFRPLLRERAGACLNAGRSMPEVTNPHRLERVRNLLSDSKLELPRLEIS